MMPSAENDAPVELIVLDVSPWMVFRALEALRGSRGLIAEQFADQLEAAAPGHMAVLADIGVTVRDARPTCDIPPVVGQQS